MEQRFCVKFAFKIENLQLSLATAFEDKYLRRLVFLSGSINFKMAVNLSMMFLWPSTSIANENIATIRNFVRSDRRLTIREMVDALNLSCLKLG